MARQFKFEITYIGGVPLGELYWHDNDKLEIIHLDPFSPEETSPSQMQLIRDMVNYMRKRGVNKITVTKLP